jgi:hypothetical protein
MTYTRKELIELLDLNSGAGTDNLEEIITISKNDLEAFEVELQEACNMTLEKYSETSQKIYDFLF